MGVEHVLKLSGLTTQYNQLNVASGALAKADNCVMRREGIIEDRRGFKLNNTFSSSIKSLLNFKSKVIAHQGTVLSYGTSSFSDYAGTYTQPTNSRVRGVEAQQNFYFTSDKGVQVLSDVTGTQARLAGCPRALDPSYALSGGASGFLNNGNQCAYRATIQRIDSNNNIITGYPSQRMWVVNSSGTGKNVVLTIYFPSECIVNDIIQFFRTNQYTGTTTDLSGDEMALVYQYSLTSSDITNGFISFTDSITDELRGEALYTSPSESGIRGANERPPLCKDLAIYKSAYMFFANTETRQRLYFSLVGVSGLSTKTITLDGVTYSFGASEIIASKQVQVFSTGVLASDIDQTSRSLVRVINRNSSNTNVYAYYLSGPDDLPGSIMIEARTMGGAQFTLNCQDTTISAMFFPAPPVSPATDIKSTSTNSVQKNALYFSKYQENEHAPVTNYVLVGPANKEILRIAPLRESLIIIKEEGVYRLTGENEQSFTVTPLDLTVLAKGSDSVAVLTNQVFMFSNQGVVTVTETGVQVVSRDIENKLLPLLQNTNLKNICYGFSYETERSYYLSVPTNTGDTVNTQTFVFNVFTKAWTRWTFGISQAVIESESDMLYFAKSGAELFKERKDLLQTDYCDPEYSISISAIATNYVDIVSSLVQPQIGWVLNQGSSESIIKTITLLGSNTYRLTFTSEVPLGWTIASAYLFPGVGLDIEFIPFTANQPALLKQTRIAKALTDSSYSENSASGLTMIFKSNFDEDPEEIDIDTFGFGWGSGPFGAFGWGGSGDGYGAVTFVPMNKQYNTRLVLGIKHKNARERLSLAGFAIDFEISSETIGV